MAYIAYTNDTEWFNALADLGTLGAIKPPMYILSESTSSLATGSRANVLGCELKEFMEGYTATGKAVGDIFNDVYTPVMDVTAVTLNPNETTNDANDKANMPRYVFLIPSINDGVSDTYYKLVGIDARRVQPYQLTYDGAMYVKYDDSDDTAKCSERLATKLFGSLSIKAFRDVSFDAGALVSDHYSVAIVFPPSDENTKLITYSPPKVNIRIPEPETALDPKGSTYNPYRIAPSTYIDYVFSSYDDICNNDTVHKLMNPEVRVIIQDALTKGTITLRFIKFIVDGTEHGLYMYTFILNYTGNLGVFSYNEVEDIHSYRTIEIFEGSSSSKVINSSKGWFVVTKDYMDTVDINKNAKRADVIDVTVEPSVDVPDVTEDEMPTQEIQEIYPNETYIDGSKKIKFIRISNATTGSNILDYISTLNKNNKEGTIVTFQPVHMEIVDTDNKYYCFLLTKGGRIVEITAKPMFELSSYENPMYADAMYDEIVNSINMRTKLDSDLNPILKDIINHKLESTTDSEIFMYETPIEVPDMSYFIVECIEKHVGVELRKSDYYYLNPFKWVSISNDEEEVNRNMKSSLSISYSDNSILKNVWARSWAKGVGAVTAIVELDSDSGDFKCNGEIIKEPSLVEVFKIIYKERGGIMKW